MFNKSSRQRHIGVGKSDLADSPLVLNIIHSFLRLHRNWSTQSTVSFINIIILISNFYP